MNLEAAINKLVTKTTLAAGKRIVDEQVTVRLRQNGRQDPWSLEAIRVVSAFVEYMAWTGEVTGLKIRDLDISVLTNENRFAIRQCFAWAYLDMKDELEGYAPKFAKKNWFSSDLSFALHRRETQAAKTAQVKNGNRPKNR